MATGIFVLADGILELGMSLSRRTESRGLDALIGAVSVIVGSLLIRHPIAGITAVALFLGIWLVAVGGVRFVGAFGAGQHRVWRIVVALTEIVVGIVVVSSPHIAYATLALFVGIGLILNGGSMLVLGVGDGHGQPRRQRQPRRVASVPRRCYDSLTPLMALVSGNASSALVVRRESVVRR